ncbi:MAG: hypothetical protein ABI867_17280 [Kofleriaceae bacterium]
MRYLALIACSGCALMTVRGPDTDDYTSRQKPDCTTSNGSVRVDLAAGAGAGLAGVVSGLVVIQDHGNLGGSMIVAGIAAFLGFYTSATIGRVRTGRCKDAIEEWNFRVPDSKVDDPDDAKDN